MDPSKRACTVIGLTGTPGTGKKTVGRVLAKRLGIPLINLNRLAVKEGAILGRDAHGYIADARRLRALTKLLIREKGAAVVASHFLPDVLTSRDVDFVAVLRCSPDELRLRYIPRRYGEAKARDNLQSEILDVCLVEALQRFGEEQVAEFDTSGRRPEDVADGILKAMRGEDKRRIGRVNWLKALKREGRLKEFFGEVAPSGIKAT